MSQFKFMSCPFEITYIRGQSEQFGSSVMNNNNNNFLYNLSAAHSSANVTYNINTYPSILNILYKEEWKPFFFFFLVITKKYPNNITTCFIYVIHDKIVREWTSKWQYCFLSFQLAELINPYSVDVKNLKLYSMKTIQRHNLLLFYGRLLFKPQGLR